MQKAKKTLSQSIKGQVQKIQNDKRQMAKVKRDGSKMGVGQNEAFETEKSST